jgi:hypothetical protein
MNVKTQADSSKAPAKVSPGTNGEIITMFTVGEIGWRLRR